MSLDELSCLKAPSTNVVALMNVAKRTTNFDPAATDASPAVLRLIRDSCERLATAPPSTLLYHDLVCDGVHAAWRTEADSSDGATAAAAAPGAVLADAELARCRDQLRFEWDHLAQNDAKSELSFVRSLASAVTMPLVASGCLAGG